MTQEYNFYGEWMELDKGLVKHFPFVCALISKHGPDGQLTDEAMAAGKELAKMVGMLPVRFVVESQSEVERLQKTIADSLNPPTL